LRGLHLRSGDRDLLQDVGWKAEGGELLALVGASGSGKSLSLRACLGLVRARPGVSAGTLEIDGPDGIALHLARPDPAGLARVRGPLLGWLPQGGGLDPTRRVGWQLRAAARLARDPADPLDFLREAGLDDPAAVAAACPHTLSGGEARRAALAVLLARGSRHLLVDEPTTGLDPVAADRVLDLLRRLARPPRAVICVSHDLAALVGRADRLVVLEGGRVAEAQVGVQPGALRSPAGRRLAEALQADRVGAA
jgi:ABC-type glutathione transport system ATPase component